MQRISENKCDKTERDRSHCVSGGSCKWNSHVSLCWYAVGCGSPMTNNNNGVNGSAAGEPASADMDSLEEMLRKVRNTQKFLCYLISLSRARSRIFSLFLTRKLYLRKGLWYCKMSFYVALYCSNFHTALSENLFTNISEPLQHDDYI